MHAALFCVVITLGSLVHGVLGSGSALVAVPLALIFLPKETMVSSMFVGDLSLDSCPSAGIR